MLGQAVGIDERNTWHCSGNQPLRPAHCRQEGESGRRWIDQAQDKMKLWLAKVLTYIGNQARQVCLIICCRLLVSTVALGLHPKTGEQIDFFALYHLLDMADEARVQGAFIGVISDCSPFGGPVALPSQQRGTPNGVFDQPEFIKRHQFKEALREADLRTEAAFTRIEIENLRACGQVCSIKLAQLAVTNHIRLTRQNHYCFHR